MLKVSQAQNLYAGIDDQNDKYIFLASFSGATGDLPLNPDMFQQGSILSHLTDSTLYINTAADGDVPTWSPIGGSFSLPITTNLAGGIVATYDQSDNFLGFGLTGAGQYFDTGSVGYNLLASVDTTAFGGTPNTTFTGYTSFGPGPSANAQYRYNATTDLAAIELKTTSSTAKSAQINVESNATTTMVELEFDTGSYKFPTTSPTSGQVMGYASANQLGWVASGLTVGNAISSSTANRVLFADGSNNLAQSTNFTFNTSTNEFAVGSGNTLTVDPTNGVVATTASSVTAFSAATSYGTAFKVFTGGGMGQLVQMGDVSQTNNLTLFSVSDAASRQITGILDGEFAVYRATGTSAKALLVKTDNLGTGQLLVELGDINGVVNSTKLSLNDSAKTIKFTGSEYQNSTVEIDSAVSTTYTVQDGDRIIYVNTNTAGVTVTLPSVVSDNKRLVKIKCSGTNGVTIVASVGSVDSGSLTTGQIGEWQALNSTITWQRVQ